MENKLKHELNIVRNERELLYKMCKQFSEKMSYTYEYGYPKNKFTYIDYSNMNIILDRISELNKQGNKIVMEIGKIKGWV